MRGQVEDKTRIKAVGLTGSVTNYWWVGQQLLGGRSTTTGGSVNNYSGVGHQLLGDAELSTAVRATDLAILLLENFAANHNLGTWRAVDRPRKVRPRVVFVFAIETINTMLIFTPFLFSKCIIKIIGANR